MTIKLIAIDIDGTLIDDNHLLPDAVITALQKKASEGVKIVLCSGRPIIGMLPFVAQLDLLKENEYTIAYNGAAVIHNLDQEVIVDHTLAHQDFLKMEALSRDLGVAMHTMDLAGMYTANRAISPYTVFDSYATQMPLHYCPVAEMNPKMHISKMMFCAEPELLGEAIKKIPAHYFEDYHLVNSMPFFFEILNKKASKGQAVADLAQRLGISQAEVMVIGDNENDVDMLAYAGVAVAMENATPNVKAVADHITKSNNDAGVAHAVTMWA